MIVYVATAPYHSYYIKVNSESSVAFKTMLWAGKKTPYGSQEFIVSLMKISILITIQQTVIKISLVTIILPATVQIIWSMQKGINNGVKTVVLRRFSFLVSSSALGLCCLVLWAFMFGPVFDSISTSWEEKGCSKPSAPRALCQDKCGVHDGVPSLPEGGVWCWWFSSLPWEPSPGAVFQAWSHELLPHCLALSALLVLPSSQTALPYQPLVTSLKHWGPQ